MDVRLFDRSHQRLLRGVGRLLARLSRLLGGSRRGLLVGTGGGLLGGVVGGFAGRLSGPLGLRDRRGLSFVRRLCLLRVHLRALCGLCGLQR